MAKKSTEKRPFQVRTRSKCPKNIQENMQRALSQKFALVEHTEIPSAEDWWECQPTTSTTTSRKSMTIHFVVVGSTGNVYTVTLDRRPTCTCPYFVRKNDVCKHLFYVLLKVVGLSHESPIVYQKAYLTNELVEIYSLLESSPPTFASNTVRVEYHRRLNNVTTTKAILCGYCQKRLVGKQQYPTIQCPSHGCRSHFHAACILSLPDIAGRLSIHDDPRRTRTTIVECPTCGEVWEHDDGYSINLAGVTGHPRIRDKSTYREVPGCY